MALDEDVDARCREIGLDGDAAPDPRQTIHLPNARRRPDPAQTLTERELPRISVDLRSVIPEQTEGSSPQTLDARDLEVVRTLGEGGMARVFLARQHSLDRDVAIKTVREATTDTERLALLAEGAITGYLEHPGIIPVHALGLDRDGRPALVMKWVEGATWSDLLANPEQADLDAHLAILEQVCTAVHFAHSRRVIHRDIKPENVLIGRYGEVYLADWGIALRLDRPASVQPMCGTPPYMAPEMVIGGIIDERTDVYLLGAVLHGVLSGKPRHAATNIRATLLAAMTSAPVEYAPSVPPALAALANAATSHDPDRRPASAADFRQAIADYRRHKGSIALVASALERLAKLRSLDSASAEIDVLTAETRFALDEALRGWPENADALRAREQLDAVLAARRLRAAELEKLAREHDPGISRGQRVAATAIIALIGVGLSVSALAVDRGNVDTRTIFDESLVPLVVVVVLAVTLRRHLLQTALNRRGFVMIFAVVAGISLHRALALVAGLPAPQVLLSDCLFAAMISAVAGVVLFRWILVPAALMAAAAVWCAVVPGDAMRAFSVGTGLALVACVLLDARDPRRPRAS